MCTNTTLHIVWWRLAGLHTNLETERQGFPCGPGERWSFTLPFQLLYNLTLIHKKQEMIANKPTSAQPPPQANCAFHVGRVNILPMLKQGGAQCMQTANPKHVTTMKLTFLHFAECMSELPIISLSTWSQVTYVQATINSGNTATQPASVLHTEET